MDILIQTFSNIAYLCEKTFSSDTVTKTRNRYRV